MTGLSASHHLDDKAKDFVLFSTGDWDEPYWTNKQHTASHLVNAGHRILYIESVGIRAPKLSSSRDLGRMWRRLKRAWKGPRPVRKNIWVYSPLAIPFKHHWPMVKWLNQGVLRLLIGWFCRSKYFKQPVVWTYHPYMLDSLPGNHWGPLVYHCVDDLSVIPGIDCDSYRAAERCLLAKSDVVFTTSQELLAHCLQVNSNSYFYPNVADIEHFSVAREIGSLPQEFDNIPEPRIGYIGVLSDFKVDFQLVSDVAEARPEWHWVFIGEEREGQSNIIVEHLKTLPNIHFIGRRDYQELPQYMRGLAVGALPSVINDYTRSMFPMKYFEYLAAGLPIVATPLEFTKQYSDGMLVSDSSASFIAAVEHQLARGRFSDEQSVSYVGDNTWSARLEKMLASIESF